MNIDNAKRKPCLLIVLNSITFFLSHRLPIALSALDSGFEVHVASSDETGSERLLQFGIMHHRIPLSRSGRNPFMEFYTFFILYRLLCELKPNVLHLVTVKPVLYGGIAARLAHITGVVAAISGLGFVFTMSGMQGRVVRWIVSFLYRRALGHNNIKIIVQNPNDLNTIQRITKLDDRHFHLLPGSGVDLSTFVYKPEPIGKPVVVMASRMLFDKGIREFMEAARELKYKGISARCILVGDVDPENPASATKSELMEWCKNDYIEWWGYRCDMAKILEQSHLVVLPSYYGEGLPKVLIEAAACGRAVITTNNPGCRDAIEPDITGLLVPARNIEALVQAISLLIENTELRQKMGKAGRHLAERKFGIDKIVAAHLSIYYEQLGINS